MSSLAETQVCPACGTPYLTKKSKGCPVCLMRGALESELDTEVDSPAQGAESSGQGRFHHYEVLRCEDGAFEELGRGAMGVTYRALDTVLGHTVALKVLDTRLAAHPQARERFLREARAAARLRHANVASVFYYGVRPSDGQCFYAMELVEGETVEARVHRAVAPPRRNASTNAAFKNAERGMAKATMKEIMKDNIIARLMGVAGFEDFLVEWF